jgi:AcrR family transcriptional regulator
MVGQRRTDDAVAAPREPADQNEHVTPIAPAADPEQQQALLDAALELLRLEGAPGLRVRKVAAAAGFSTMGVYTYFGSKDGLVEALRLDGFQRLHGAVLRAAGTSSGTRRVKALADAYRLWAIENPTQYQVMFTALGPDHVPSDRARRAGIETFDVLVDALSRRPSTAARSVGDAWRDAYVLWGMMHGHVMLEIARVAPREDGIEHGAAYGVAVDVMLAALS